MKRYRALLCLLAFTFLAAALCTSTLTHSQTKPQSSSGSRRQGAAGAAGTFNVRAFGAKGDGKALDTTAINRAIETAAAAGGGTVHFPAGTYRSFSIHLKSNISLYLDHGATILAADPKDGDGKYDLP